MKKSDAQSENVRRFEQAVHELIDEGHSILDFHGLLRAAADRAGVELDEVHPTRH